MTVETTKIEISFMIDCDGNVVVDTDPDNLGNRYEEEVSSTAPNSSRTYTLKVTVPTPKPIALSAVIPDKGDEPVNITVV